MLEAYENFHMGVEGSENRPVALVRGPGNSSTDFFNRAL
jgi:hypothetical protein